ncbi:uncharacterized protein DDB_G0271670-like [Panonychus citri]|uniref:uncharacterized protein DDB_G0271670-like n=1 Tax=Panonychus citri TaxID=50023 RepID=UPI002307D174|nr:uncharacterized protein DDB_G0271670-like [Panonychus citri]
MPLKLPKSKRKVRKLTNKINKKKSKYYLYRHVTKVELIKQYEELCETGKCFVEQFEALRTEYCNVRDKFNAVQENNRELASRNAALLHEIEVTRLQLTKLTKDQLIKISGAEKEFDAFKNKLAKTLNSLISNHDPFFILKQDFEKSLSVGDITHLDSITTVRSSRLSRCLVDEQRHQDRVKEKINNIFLERIDLTAMSEEASPISSGQNNGSTFSIGSKKSLDEHNSSSHLNFTTLLEPPTNSTMIETPSYRRIVPKSPHLNGSNNQVDESSLTGEDSGWEYNSDFIRVPPSEPMLSTSLDSIQNFIPKSPLLTQPAANHTSTRDSIISSNSSTCKSYFNRLSVAFPEKTPDQSPVTSFDARCRTSRRLINSASTSRESASKHCNTIDASAPIESRVTSISTTMTSSTSTPSTSTSTSTTSRATTSTARVSTRTSTRTFDETKSEVQNDDSNDKNSNFSKNDSETESIADCETQGFRRSKRKRRKVCYREK